MQCLDARRVMEDVLDGADDGLLMDHMADCVSCQAAWSRLAQVEALFRAEGLSDPPSPNFAASVLSQLPSSTRSKLASLEPAPAVGAWLPLATLLAAVFSLLPIVLWWQLIWPGMGAAALGAPLFNAGTTLSRAMIDGLNASVVSIALYAALAVAMAAMWFGALVLPRHAAGGMAGRGRPYLA